jgi:hypothetical protein
LRWYQPYPVAAVVGEADWRAAGVKVVGVIAETHTLAYRSCSAGFLRISPICDQVLRSRLNPFFNA